MAPDEDNAQPIEPKGIPVAQVIQLKQQGLTNDQITQTLQRDGYKVHEIFDALNSSEIRKGTYNINLEKGDTMVDNPMPAPAMPAAPPPGMPAAPPPAMPEVPAAPDMGTAPMSEPFGAGDTKMEEMAESIIDEKWQDLIANVKKIIEWKDQTELRLKEIETKMEGVKANVEAIQSSVLEKVGDYDKNIQGVATNVAALEKVFQKILPGFIENVNELSEVAKEFKLARHRAAVKSTSTK